MILEVDVDDFHSSLQITKISSEVEVSDTL